MIVLNDLLKVKVKVKYNSSVKSTSYIFMCPIFLSLFLCCISENAHLCGVGGVSPCDNHACGYRSKKIVVNNRYTFWTIHLLMYNYIIIQIFPPYIWSVDLPDGSYKYLTHWVRNGKSTFLIWAEILKLINKQKIVFRKILTKEISVLKVPFALPHMPCCIFRNSGSWKEFMRNILVLERRLKGLHLPEKGLLDIACIYCLGYYYGNNLHNVLGI